MTPPIRQTKKDLRPTPEELAEFQDIIDKIKAGKIVPVDRKIEQARKDLKKAGLID